MFTIGLYQSPGDYSFLPSYEVIGTLTGAGGSYDVVCINPTDVRFTQETSSGYREMMDNKQEALKTLSGVGGYTMNFR